jgi:hypothetical protein
MKKLVLISLFLVGIVGLVNATPITCAVLMTGNTSGYTGSTCTVNPDPGFFISSLTLTGTDDYTGLQSGSPVVTYSGTLNQSSTVFTGLTFCAVDTGTTGSIPCSDGVLPANTVSGLDLSTYSVNLTSAGNVVAGGVVTGASIVLDLNYGETLNRTPEPATLGLTSAALLGLALLARRKKTSQARG